MEQKLQIRRFGWTWAQNTIKSCTCSFLQSHSSFCHTRATGNGLECVSVCVCIKDGVINHCFCQDIQDVSWFAKSGKAECHCKISCLYYEVSVSFFSHHQNSCSSVCFQLIIKPTATLEPQSLKLLKWEREIAATVNIGRKVCGSFQLWPLSFFQHTHGFTAVSFNVCGIRSFIESLRATRDA